MIRRKLHYLWLFILVSANALSAEPSAENPAVGVLNIVNYDRNILVVDDWTYTMPLNLKVYSHRGKRVNRYALKRGQHIRFTLKPTEGGAPVLDSVWIVRKSGARH